MENTVWLRAGTITSWAGEEEELWRAATITEEASADGKQMCTCVTCDDGEALEMTVERGELLLRDVLPPEGVDDLVSLGNLHPPAILDNLRLRFQRPEPDTGRHKSIYTYCGNICIAINPYERLAHLYSQETKESYINLESFGDNPPHIYAVAETAYANMMRSASTESQSILVSGESGAGKTESVKIMINYLADRNDRGGVDSEAVAEAVVRSTPLLETFGNSKTLRNNNSSRFGKFTQVLFDREGSIVGSRVDVYLLEKSRIVHQLVGERNYHVFYQLLSAPDAALPGAPAEGGEAGLYDEDVPPLTRAELGLPEVGPEAAAAFQFLKGSECFQADGIDDGAWFGEMIGTMTAIGITVQEQQQMLRVVAAVMQIGQIEFESAMGASGDEKALVVGGEDSPTLALVSSLLSCAPADLRAVLETRHISARTETYTVDLNPAEAEAARDALGKALYDRLFAWLVGRVNKSTAPIDDSKVASTIGVLDIFGFESFGKNTLEQLLINFANEKLQQQFTWYVFKLEQAEYEKEGIVWNPVDFKDNQPILDVLEGHNSILALLDEECRLQRGSDESFVEKLRKQAKRLPKVATDVGAKPVAVLTFPKMTKEPQFILRHYAGEVEYSADGFREKNKDSVHPDTLELVQHGSSDSFINKLFEAPVEVKPKPGARKSRGGAKMVTLGNSFKGQLASLVGVINSTTVHYVRCIKPNFKKSTDDYDLAGVSSQLRCQGILEAIRISRAAYPNRVEHAAFLKRYVMCLRDAEMRIEGASERSLDGVEGELETAKALLSNLRLDPTLPDGNYQIGKTKCFFRREAMEALEAARGRVIGSLVICVQAEARGWLARRAFARMKRAVVVLQRVARGMRARVWVRRHRAAIMIQAATRCMLCSRAYSRKREAAITMQCAWRMRVSKRRLFDARRAAAATRIQARQRGLVQQRKFGGLRGAVLVCQREARRTLCRLRFIAMVEEARQDAMLSSQVERLQQALQESEEARLLLEEEKAELEEENTDLKRQLMTVSALNESSSAGQQPAEGVPPEASTPAVPSGPPPKATPAVPQGPPPTPQLPKGGPPTPRVPAGGPPSPKLPAGGPPQMPAGGPPKVPAGGPPKVPAGGPPKLPAGAPPMVPMGKPPLARTGSQPMMPLGGPPSPPGTRARAGSAGGRRMSISEASASGQAAIFKLEGELLASRKQQQQQKKNFEESLKRKDEKVRKMEKQQADKAKKQAEAFSTATELTKENEALQTKMQNFSVVRAERDELKKAKADLAEELAIEKVTVEDLSSQVEAALANAAKGPGPARGPSVSPAMQKASARVTDVARRITRDPGNLTLLEELKQAAVAMANVDQSGSSAEIAVEDVKRAVGKAFGSLFGSAAGPASSPGQAARKRFGWGGNQQQKQQARQAAGGRAGGAKRPRYPYRQHNYFPDEQEIFEEDESSASVEILATKQQLLVDKPSALVFTVDEEPVEIGHWVEAERRVISNDEKALRDLLEQATSNSERPAPPEVTRELTLEARSANVETALRTARWLAKRLEGDSIPVLLKTLQLMDRMAKEANIEWFAFVTHITATGLTSAATFSKRDPLHGDKPAELIRQGGERVQKALREMAGEKEVVDLQFLVDTSVDELPEVLTELGLDTAGSSIDQRARFCSFLLGDQAAQRSNE